MADTIAKLIEDIECEGFDNALVHYDDYSKIPDTQFQSLYKEYLCARENLVSYLVKLGHEEVGSM